MKKKNICIIPARAGSTEIPNKNLLLINSKPLIAYTIIEALKSKIIDKVVVSTDSERIAKVAKKYGAEVVMRPANISTNTSRIELALRHAVLFYNKEKSYFPEIVVFMQANVPMRKPGLVDDVVNKLIKTDADAVVSVSQSRIHPQWMHLVINDRLIRYTKARVYRRQDLPKIYFMDGGVEAITVKTLMSTINHTEPFGYLGKDVRAVVQDEYCSIEIDSYRDIEIAKALLKKGI